MNLSIVKFKFHVRHFTHISQYNFKVDDVIDINNLGKKICAVFSNGDRR